MTLHMGDKVKRIKATNGETGIVQKVNGDRVKVRFSDGECYVEKRSLQLVKERRR